VLARRGRLRPACPPSLGYEALWIPVSPPLFKILGQHRRHQRPATFGDVDVAFADADAC